MEKELTAAEVRALPVGAKVTVHGHDRYGYPTHLPCEVVAKRTGKGKELRYTWNFDFERMGIRAHKGRTFTMEVKENGM